MTALIALCLLGGPVRLIAEWTAPKELPFARVHAIARVGAECFVGGLRGLQRGKPGKWRQIDDRPVKEMLSDGHGLWVLYGDGSVDKLGPREGRLYYDVLQDAAKRPWASCMAIASQSDSVFFGGQGGWMQKTPNGLAESYPKELQGQVVTALLKVGEELWIGTQRNGLFGLRKGKWSRYGFGAELPDLWITALAYSGGNLFVGVADGGVAMYSGGRFVALDCPAKKVRKIVFFQGRLAVGGLDGAWIRHEKGWQRLSDEETTALVSLGDQLAVGTPKRLLWWK